MITRAHLRDPRFEEVHAERRKITATLQHLERAREAVRDKRWADTVREVALVRTEVKKSLEVDLLEAEGLLGQGKIEEALALVTDCIRTPEGRRSTSALTLRARCLYVQGNMPQAERHLAEVIKMDPDNSEAGMLLRSIRRLEARKAEGNEFFRSGNNAKAVEAYTACIEMAPESKAFLSTVYANRAAARMKLREWELASADCDECLALNSQYIKGYLRRAECGQKIGSKEALERALRDLNAAKDLATDSATVSSIEKE
jgi:tetratricopeptide (TPR) repeat protein